MRKDTKDFIIEYDKDIDYIDDLIKKIEQETSRIFNFFELKNLKEKKKIKICVNVNMELDKNVNLEIGQFVPILFH